MKAIIGITGPSGSGKSTVSDILKREYGAHIVDADKIAREVLEKGTEGLKEVTAVFGEEYLHNDGSLNRRMLGEKIFSDKESREKLNNITLPRILERMVNEALTAGEDIVIFDAPLLTDCEELMKLCGEIIYVRAPEALLLKRITERDGISEKTARNRIASQKTDDEFIKKSTVILENNGDENKLKESLRRILCQVLKKKSC